MSSFKIGSFRGIDIRLHITFPLVLVWAAFQWGSGRGLTHAAFGVLLIGMLFVCVVLHELGHSLVARAFGVNVEDIVLLPIGGVAQLRSTLDEPKEEFLVAVAGPAVNFGLAALLFPVFYLLTNNLTQFGLWSLLDQTNLTAMTVYLFLANVTLVGFNLLPAFPMDGGRIFRSFLAFFLSYWRATWVAVRIGQLLAVAFVLYGLFNNFLLLLIGAFVFVAANAELRRVEARDILSAIQIGQYVQRSGRALSPEQLIFSANSVARLSPQRVWPVVSGGRLVGLVSRDKLDESNAGWSVGEVMDRDFPTLNPRATLYDAQRVLLNGDYDAAAVIDGDLFVGPFSLQDLANAVRRLPDRRQRPIF